MGQLLAVKLLLHPHPDRLVNADDVLVIGHQHLILVTIDVQAVVGLLLVGQLVVVLTGQREVDTGGPVFVVVHL